jgi:hypothetical protein
MLIRLRDDGPGRIVDVCPHHGYRPRVAARSVADQSPIGERNHQVASRVTTEALPDRVRQRVGDVALDLAQRKRAFLPMRLYGSPTAPSGTGCIWIIAMSAR